MLVQVNSDKNITVDARVIDFVEGEVNRALARFAKKITRVEVHLSDVNSRKFGTDDKHCRIEVRPAGHRPITASKRAATIQAAILGALIKMRSSLQTFFGRMGKQPRKAATVTVTSASRVKPSRPKAIEKAIAAGATATAQTGDDVQTASGGRSPKKKGIYRARRAAWPRR